MGGEFGPDLESACQIVGNRKRKQLDLSGQQHTSMKPKNTICLWFDKDAMESESNVNRSSLRDAGNPHHLNQFGIYEIHHRAFYFTPDCCSESHGFSLSEPQLLRRF